jgi:hypothetical protein
MWTVIYCAQSLEIAEKLKSALGQTGVLVLIRACGSKAEADASEGQFYEISVTASDVEKAHDYIIENGY